SITFNMGEGNLKKSTLLAKLNRGDYVGARKAFDLYVNSGGEYMRGLQRRRDGEQEMWDDREPTLPDEPVDHPEMVDVPKDSTPSSMATSSTGNTAIMVGGGGVYGATQMGSRAVTRTVERGDLTIRGILISLLMDPEFLFALALGALSVWGAAYIWFE